MQKGCGTKRKSDKENVYLYERRLSQKAEEEAARAKRHKERLEMDEKFLEVLKKLIEK